MHHPDRLPEVAGASDCATQSCMPENGMRPSIPAIAVLVGVLLALGSTLGTVAGPLPPAPPVKHYDPLP